ncbi:MAG: hypothetical protein E7517_05190 [Ruminococcaceae bacterium]|nr:hypothetical protein [Oscillospiraceae bacterium]
MKKRTIVKILVFTLVLCIGVLPLLPAVAQGEVLATVLFTTDTKGFTQDLGYIQRYKEMTDNAILLNCGNFTKGSPEASLSNAKYSSQLMKAADYDLISLGTDDYVYGFRALKRYGDYAGCEILSGNVKYSSADVYAVNTVKQINGVNIGFFSVVDGKSKDYIPTARSDGYTFEKEIAFAQEQTDILKAKCDKVVCLASFADNNKNFTPKILAESVSGLDVLICSNMHSQLNESIGGTNVVGAGEMLSALGEIQLLNDGTITVNILPKYERDSKGEELEGAENTYRKYGDSPVYNTAYEDIMEEFEGTLDSLVAQNKTTIFGVDDDIDISLLEETPLGDLFADAITLAGDKYKASQTAYKNHYVVGVVNGSCLQNNIDAGDIDIKNVFDARGIAEDVYFYECNSAFLFDLMEKSIKDIKYDKKTDYIYNPCETFLQISGFNILVNPLNKAGSKVIKMFLKDGDDEIIIKKNDDKKYLIGLNESLAKGFALYDEFTGMKPVYVGDFLTNYVRTAIASNVSEDYYLSPGTESRITFKRIEELQPNGDAWATIDRDFEDYAAAEVYVDGIDNMDCSQVDKNGEVRITFNTGAHGVTVNGENLYVSTASGIGLKKGSVTPIVDYKLYYKTLDDAYKIDESQYSSEEVEGYYAFLGRAYVQTKLTEEGEVVKATQDIFTVWDDFLENPEAFVEKEEDEAEEADEEESAAAYPDLDDFAYTGNFQSNVFENTPKTTFKGALANDDAKASEKGANSRTGDTITVILYIAAAALLAAAVSIGVLLYRNKKKFDGVMKK